MLPPIEAHILASAFAQLKKEIPNIEIFSDEFKNTVANCFYWKSFFLNHGHESLSFIFQNGFTKRAAEYQSLYVINGADAARDFVLSMRNLNKEERDYWSQLFVDFTKYNLSMNKSLLRRSIERPFCRPFPEHQGLWQLMSQPVEVSKVRRY